MKKNKLAALLGAEVDLGAIKVDKNAEARQELRRKGFQIPELNMTPREFHSLEISEMYQAHKNMPDVFTARFSTVEVKRKATDEKFVNILVELKQCMYAVGEPTEVYISLYSESKRAFISDEFRVNLTTNGFPEVGAFPCQCLFIDVARADLSARLHVVCRIYRVGALVWKPAEKRSKKDLPHQFRRPYGVAVLPLKDKTLESLKAGPMPVQPPPVDIFVPPQEKDFMRMHEVIIRSLMQPDEAKRDVLEKPKNAIGVALGVRMWAGNVADPDVRDEIDDFKNLVPVPKRRFAGPKPTEELHEMRIVLVKGSFANALKSKKSEKNVQIRVELRDANRQVVPGSIVRGRGPMAVTSNSYESLVHYHVNAPEWRELVTVRLPPQKTMETCHIYFEFSHCSTSEKEAVPFGFTYMPVINPRIYTVIMNGPYELIYYEFGKKLKPTDNYLQLDADTKEKSQSKERFIVQTELRSTEISQDVDVHQVLNWHRVPRDQRSAVLRCLWSKQGDVLAPNMGVLLQKLGDILCSDNRDYVEHHEDVFATYMRVLAAVGSRDPGEPKTRFTDPTAPTAFSRPFADVFVRQHLEQSVIYHPIIKYWRSLLGWMVSPEVTIDDPRYEPLLSSLRAIDHVFRIIIKSFTMHLIETYQSVDAAGAVREKEQFAKTVLYILNTINTLMSIQDAWALDLQVAVITNFRTVYDELRAVLPEEQIVPLACQYLSHIGTQNEAIVLHKLAFIRELLEKKILKPSRQRVIDLKVDETVSEMDKKGLKAWRELFLPQMIQQLYSHIAFDNASAPFGLGNAFSSLVHITGKVPQRSRARHKARVCQDMFCMSILKDILPFIQDMYTRHAVQQQQKQQKPDPAFVQLMSNVTALMPDVMRVLVDVLKPEVDEDSYQSFFGELAFDMAHATIGGGRGSGSSASRTVSFVAQDSPTRKHTRVASSGVNPLRRTASGIGSSGTRLLRTQTNVDEASLGLADMHSNVSAISEDDVMSGPLSPRLARTETISSPRSGTLRRSATSASLQSSSSTSSLASASTAVEAPKIEEFDPYDPAYLPPDLSSLNVVEECVVVAISLAKLVDHSLFQQLLKNLDNGVKPQPVPLHVLYAGASQLSGAGEDDDLPPPPPPPPEDDDPPPPIPDDAAVAAAEARAAAARDDAQIEGVSTPREKRGPPMTSAPVFELLHNRLTVCTEITTQSAFNQYWVVMRMLEILMSARLLKWIAPTILEHYMQFADVTLESGVRRSKARGSLVGASMLNRNQLQEKQVWEAYWKLGCSLLLADDLSLETMKEPRSHFVKSRYGDLRAGIAKQLQHTWSKFGAMQQQFIETLSGPIIDLAQSKCLDVKEAGCNMYWDFLQMGIKDPLILRNLQSHTIDAVGDVVHNTGIGRLERAGMEDYRQFFSDYLPNRISAHNEEGVLTDSVQSFLHDINELFGHLWSLESLPRRPMFEDERTSACLLLMRYLRESGKQELYEKYLQYLCELHAEINNPAEKGIALLSHQESLTWDDNRLEVLHNLLESGTGALKRGKPVYLRADTERNRKIELCNRAIAAFEEAEMWEKCIEVADVLIDAYKNRLFNLTMLTQMLKSQAEWWDKIAKRDRIFRSFYRVYYRGSGFSEEFHDKEFIYRSGQGAFPEDVRAFTERIKQKFPDAKTVNSSDPPSEDDLKEADNGGQYIQITKLTVSSPEEMNGDESKWNRLDVPPPHRYQRFHANNGVDVFYFTRVDRTRANPEDTNEYRNLWVLKTFIVAEEKLPCLRRRVPVLEKKEVLVSPIENAVFNIRSKNDELREIIDNIEFDIKVHSPVDIKPLSMQLTGVIDAAVQGGINKYREAFFTEDYLHSHPQDVKFIEEFKAQLAEQLQLLGHGLHLFAGKCDASLKPLYDHLHSRYNKMGHDLSELLADS